MNGTLTRRQALGVAAGTVVAAGLIGYDFLHRHRRHLRLGDRGDDVLELQIRVAGWARDLGDKTSPAFLPVNGAFGPETAAAVRRFQQGYELPRPDGEVDDATWDQLYQLERLDESTAHFSWTELLRRDPDHRVTPEIRENIRRLMYKLEALRRKLGDIEITIKAGYVATAALGGEERIGDDRLHSVGAAADFTAFGVDRALWYRTALSCGFTGLGPIDRHWQHSDSRSECNGPAGSVPWYANGDGYQ